MSCKNEFTRQRAASCGCNNAETAAEPVSVPGTVQDTESENSECKRRRSEEFSEPVCVSVDKVYDACRERTCVVDERVYFTECGQEIIAGRISRPRNPGRSTKMLSATLNPSTRQLLA